jgi:hypothetical protein
MARGKQPIAGFTAGRPVTLLGTFYAKGATVPSAVVGGLRHASALISRRTLVPTSAQYPSKRASARLGKPSPVTLNAKERRGLGA